MLIVNKEASASRPPTGAPPLDPAGRLPSPRTPATSPQPWRQIDAYDDDDDDDDAGTDAERKRNRHR